MKGSFIRKAAGVLLGALFVAVLQVPALAFADSSQTAIPADYQSQSLTQLFAAGQVTVDNTKVTIAADEATDSITVSGSQKQMKSATFAVGKTFNFSENAVARFSVCGLAAAGKKVVLDFYLDDQTDPFCSLRLASNTSTNNGGLQTVTQNVLASNITGTHTVSFKVSDCSASPSFSLASIEFAESSVPVVNINIDESLGTIAAMNGSDDHSVNCYGTLSIDVPEGATSAMTGESLEGKGTSEELEMEYIRGRGNSTWDENKKPYKIKLESKADLLGMGANKHWALMANALDNTHLRNLMTSRLGEAMDMPFTPSMEPVEVIMNGDYLGSYMLSEVTRVGETRVDIADLDDDPDATDEATISGGYLLSLGNWTLDDDKLNFTTEKAKGVLQVEAPDLFTSKNETQFNYIKNYVQQVEDAIYDHDYDSYASLMDIEAAVKYYWFEELSANGDGYTSGSCYLYKDRGGKLCWGPIWDFDLAWGGLKDSVTDCEDWQERPIFWNNELFKDEAYVNAAKEAYPAFKAELEKICQEGGVLDQLASLTRTAYYYDYIRWDGYQSESGGPVDSDEGEGDGDDASESSATLDPLAAFDKNIEYLRTWTQNRVSWTNDNLASLGFEPTTITFKADGKVVSTQQGYIDQLIGTLPEAPAKSGYAFTGWQATQVLTLEKVLKERGLTEEEYRQMLIDDSGMTPEEADEEIAALKKGMESTYMASEYTPTVKDMVLTACYEDRSEMPAVTNIVTLAKTYYGVESDGNETQEVCIDYQLLPFESEGDTVTMTSSNLAVVVPDTETNSLQVNGPGDATVTLTASTGFSISVKVHIYTREEYEELPLPDVCNPSLAETSRTVNVGTYGQLPLTGIEEGQCNVKDPSYYSSDQDVLTVGSCGTFYANKAGTATVCCVTEMGVVSMCKITVVDPAIRVGSVVTKNGLKYKVTANSASTRTVALVGATSKTRTALTVKNTVTINGKKYKVTEVAKNAFKGFKKLKSVTIGANVRIIGASAFANCTACTKVTLGKRVQIVQSRAFAGCKKLKKATIKSKLKPKIYSTAFKNTHKKLKVYVPKSQKKYYRLILGKKRVKVLK